MYKPTTPTHAAGLIEVKQEPTPPSTVTKQDTTFCNGYYSCDHGSDPSVRRTLFPQATGAAEDLYVTQYPPESFHIDRPEHAERLRTQRDFAQITLPLRLKQELPSPGNVEQQLDENGRPVNEVRLWIESSSTPEQRRKRVACFKRVLWTSDEKCRMAYHTLRDPMEEDPSVQYKKCDGNCTEVWRPQIGDEGIETEEDLRMILLARRQHKARAEAMNKAKHQVYKTQRKAGIKPANIDMTQVFFGPLIKAGDSDSSSSDTDGYPESESESEPEIDPHSIYVSDSDEDLIDDETWALANAPFDPLEAIVTVKGIRVRGVVDPGERAYLIGLAKREKRRKERQEQKIEEVLDKIEEAQNKKRAEALKKKEMARKKMKEMALKNEKEMALKKRKRSSHDDPDTAYEPEDEEFEPVHKRTRMA